MSGGKEYAVVLAIKASNQASGPIQAVGSGLKRLQGQMSAMGRGIGLAKVSNEVGSLRNAFGSLAGVGGMLGGLFAPLAALGVGAGLGGLSALAHQAAEVGDALGEMSARTGVGIEQIQELQFAAMRAGASNEELESGLNKLNSNIGQAVNNTGKAKEVFAALGISLKDQFGNVYSAGAIMGDLAEKMKDIPDPAQRAAVAAALLGKEAGAKLAPMLAEGADGLIKAAKEARKFGIVTEAQAKAAGAFMDSVDDLGKATIGLRNAIGFELIPLFQPLTKGMVDWIGTNREVIASGIGEFAAFLTDTFGALGSAITWTVDAIGGVGPALGVLGAVFGPVLAAMFPVTVAIGAIAAGAFLIWKHWEPIKAFFVGIWDDVLPAWQAFLDFAMDGLTILLTPLRTVIAAIQAVGKGLKGQGFDFSGVGDSVQKGVDTGKGMAGRGKALMDAVGPNFGKGVEKAPPIGIPEARPQQGGAIGIPEVRPSDAIPRPEARPSGGRGGGVAEAAASGNGHGAGSAMAPPVSMVPPPAANQNQAEVVLRILSDVPVKVEGMKQVGAGLTVRTDLPTGKGRAATG